MGGGRRRPGGERLGAARGGAPGMGGGEPGGAAGTGAVPEGCWFWGPSRLARAVRRGEVTAEGLARSFINRQRRLDKELGVNAVVVPLDEAEVILKAKAADVAQKDAQSRGESLGALHGVPYTLKESYDVKGMQSIWGCPGEAEAPVRIQSSEVHSKLEAAGAILLGKTNTPPLLADWQSYNSVFGTTGNPYDPQRTAGGSSGGSAASVAAGFAAFDIGSDIGGSIRVPASFCGIWGHKITFGIISPEGHNLKGFLGPGSDMAVQGPLAQSAEDLELLLEVLAGVHSLESKGLRVELPAPRRMPEWGSSGVAKAPKISFRVAVWSEEPGLSVAESVQGVLTGVEGVLMKDFGIECVRITYEKDILPRVEEALVLAGKRGPLSPDLASSKGILRFYSRMLRMQLSARVPADTFQNLVGDAQALDYSDESPAAQALRDATRHYWHSVQDFETRAHLQLGFERFLDRTSGGFDVILMPGTALPAFPHSTPRDQALPLMDADHRLQLDGKECPYFETMAFWQLWANLALLPSTAFPVGVNEAGLPLGLQVMGAAYEDRTTIAFAKAVHQRLSDRRRSEGGELVPRPLSF